MLNSTRRPCDTDAGGEIAAESVHRIDAANPWSFERQHRCKPREVIFLEGNTGDRVFLVRSGLVKLLSYLPNGRARIVRLYTDNHWLGLEGLLGRPYAHTAIALGDVELACCPVSRLQQLQRDNAHVFGEWLAQWHDDLAAADQWIVDFSTGDIKSRVARLLVYLAKLEFGPACDSVVLLTVQEMADVLGVTQESVSRILASFKRNKLLQPQPDTTREVFDLDSRRVQQEALA
jgi:CRP/FNR family transcriptional regulator